MAKRTSEGLLKQFADRIMAQKEAMRYGDTRRGNRYADGYMAAWRELRDLGDDGREALATLLDDGHADVRAAAAACLLRYRTEDALRVLNEVALGKGLAAFEASVVLEQWNEQQDKRAWPLDPE